MVKKIIEKIKARQIINCLTQNTQSYVHQISRENLVKNLNVHREKVTNELKSNAKRFGVAAAGMTALGIGVGVAERKGLLYPSPMPHEAYFETLNKARGIKTDSNNLLKDNNLKTESKTTGDILKEGITSMFNNELEDVKNKSLSETITSTVIETKGELISKESFNNISQAIATWGVSHTPYLEKAMQPIVAAVNIINEVNPIKSSALQSISEIARLIAHSILNGGSIEKVSSNNKSEFLPEDEELNYPQEKISNKTN